MELGEGRASRGISWLVQTANTQTQGWVMEMRAEGHTEIRSDSSVSRLLWEMEWGWPVVPEERMTHSDSCFKNECLLLSCSPKAKRPGHGEAPARVLSRNTQDTDMVVGRMDESHLWINGVKRVRPMSPLLTADTFLNCSFTAAHPHSTKRWRLNVASPRW